MESARIVGALARYTGDFSLAEDIAQEALAEALVSWSVDGVPAQPVGWLLTVGRRRAIDTFRRRSALDARFAVLASDLDTEEPGVDTLFDPDAIDDDVLALMFVSCHPVLSKEARIALTLRVVGGLSSDEIAKAFLVPVPTIQARITRAKKTLAAARVPFVVPEPQEMSERLGSVLQVVYLIFTEGSFASGGDEWIRTDLTGEARRLARVLVRLAPEPEAFGLLALLELTAARFPARVDSVWTSGAARGPGPPVVGPHRDPAWPGGTRAGRRGRSRAGRVRLAGRDRRVSCGRAVGGRDRLAADRHPLRSPRPVDPVADHRTQSRRRGRDGLRSGRRPGPGRRDRRAR